jgi:hypothetical protein
MSNSGSPRSMPVTNMMAQITSTVIASRRPKRRLGLAFFTQQRRDPSQLGLHARRHHDAASTTIGDQRALIGHVAPVAERQVRLVHQARELFDRLRLAGQRRLLDLELRCLDQPQIGRHGVAGLDTHHVAGHELACRYHPRLPVAHGVRRERRHLPERGDGTLGAVFLYETDHGVQHHDGHDHQRIHQVADQARNDRGGDQHQDHEIGELAEEHQERSSGSAFTDLVGAIPFAARPRFFRAQAGAWVYIQTADDLFRRQLMPDGRVYVVRPACWIPVIFHGGTTRKR